MSDMTEKQKTSVDDIIGIIKTEEKTDSVELKKEYYREQSKDKHYTYLNYSRDGYIGSFFVNDKPMTNKEVWELLNALHEENEQLKKELKVYRKIATCSNCNYHNYDWFDDGDEFEVCDKGNDTSNMICEDWEEL